MMKNWIVFILISFLWIKASGASVTCEEGKSFMSDIGEKVISLLTDKTISDKVRADQFRVILDTKFNGKAIAKFVLGRYWKQATQDEKEKFLELFKETTVASYATRFKEYTSEKFEILGCRQELDGGVTILTQIIRKTGSIPIDWKLFKKDDEIRIYDVFLEGISMSITQRSEFASVIQKGGGKVQSINTALEKQLATNLP